MSDRLTLPPSSPRLPAPHTPVGCPYQVDGGQDKGLPVSGQLPEARCRFVVPASQGRGGNIPRSNDNSGNPNAGTVAAVVAAVVAPANATNNNSSGASAAGNIVSTTAGGGSGNLSGGGGVGGGGGGGSANILDFGHVSVGMEVGRTVMLQNMGKSQAAFFLDTSELQLVRRWYVYDEYPLCAFSS